MYPGRELEQLAARKAILRLRIAQHRWQAIESGAALAQSLGWLDRAVAHWRSIPPVARMVGVPAALMLVRRLLGRLGSMRGVPATLRLLPLVLQVLRTLTASRARPGANVNANASSQSTAAPFPSARG